MTTTTTPFNKRGNIQKIIFSEILIPENQLNDSVYLSSIPQYTIFSKRSGLESKAVQVERAVTDSISSKRGEILGESKNFRFRSPFRSLGSSQEGILYKISWEENDLEIHPFQYLFPIFIYLFIAENEYLLLKGKVDIKKEMIIPNVLEDSIKMKWTAEIWVGK